MEEPQKSIELFLAEKVKEHGLTVKRLSELSGITSTHLEHLLNGRFEKLPPAPYVRGYLSRLASILEFDLDEVWQTVKRHEDMRRSGPADRLPENRFRKISHTKYIWIGAAGLLLLIYLSTRLTAILGEPTITIIDPKDQITTTADNHIAFRGTLTNTTELTINGESVPIGANGAWATDISLEPGLNTVNLVAKKLLGSQTSIIRQVIYQPKATSSTPVAPAKAASTTTP